MADDKVKITSLEGFLEAIDEFKSGGISADAMGLDMIYRGQSQAGWEVTSTSYRERKTANNGTLISDNLLKYNQDLVAEARRYRGREFEGFISDLHILAKLRHYGAATMLMDFTESAITALWFACQKTKDKNGDEVETNGEVFCLNIAEPIRFPQIKPEDEERKLSDIFQEIFSSGATSIGDLKIIARWVPPLDNRVLKQDSFFIFNEEGKLNNGIFKKIITIDKGYKGEILDQLKLADNISEASMFPDFYGFARYNRVRKTHNLQSQGGSHV